VCLLALLILAGCGGAAKTHEQTLQGNGFRFQAPESWVVVRKASSVAATHGPVDRIEVMRFRLVKEYRPQRFAAASHELDTVIGRIAKQLSGRVASRQTIQLAGRRSRSYRIQYGKGTTQEIAFVLDGRTEYQLLCRRGTAEPEDACAQLFSSFALG
jgi:hypothetical protein